jgi:hypothetical protein
VTFFSGGLGRRAVIIRGLNHHADSHELRHTSCDLRPRAEGKGVSAVAQIKSERNLLSAFHRESPCHTKSACFMQSNQCIFAVTGQVTPMAVRSDIYNRRSHY